MTSRSKSVTLAELRKLMDIVLQEARQQNAGPIADAWRQGFDELMARARTVAK